MSPTTAASAESADLLAGEPLSPPPLPPKPLPSAGMLRESLLQVSRRQNDALIAIVDDEPINVKVVQKYLKSAGYRRFLAISDSREATAAFHRDPPDVVVLDIMMPHISGLQILEALRGDIRLHPIPVLILTAASETETKLHALELGATDFLSKPVDSAELVARVRNMLLLKAHHDQLAAYSAQLEEEVRLRTAKLAQSRQEVIHVLASAAEYRDQETGNHVIRVGRYAGIVARQLGWEPFRVELIEQAAVLHDVGKIAISDAILLKPGKLDASEMKLMHQHCECGMNILMGVPCDGRISVLSCTTGRRLSESPILRMAARIAMSHHERWDGTGYPLGLRGEAIPIEGRITAVADVFDALNSRRPYKPALPFDRCIEIIDEGRGNHFDPNVVDAFLSRIDDVLRVAVDLRDESAVSRDRHPEEHSATLP